MARSGSGEGLCGGSLVAGVLCTAVVLVVGMIRILTGVNVAVFVGTGSFDEGGAPGVALGRTVAGGGLV
ncbi:MAG: hypothetical protein WAN40_00835, partial [Thermoplasmata archaeon]